MSNQLFKKLLIYTILAGFAYILCWSFVQKVYSYSFNSKEVVREAQITSANDSLKVEWEMHNESYVFHDKEAKAHRKEADYFLQRMEEIHETAENNRRMLGNFLPDGTDLDKLAKAVARHETGNCTIGNSASRNNCFGIMAWDSNGKRYFKSYSSKEESYEDFKSLWERRYKTFPTYALASRYSGNDRAGAWLSNVTQFYNEM